MKAQQLRQLATQLDYISRAMLIGAARQSVSDAAAVLRRVADAEERLENSAATALLPDSEGGEL